MPLLRHLAATILPLASTAAGIVAVGVAVQFPAGPAERISVPNVASATAPRPAIVSRVAPAPPRVTVRLPTRSVVRASRPFVVVTPGPAAVPAAVADESASFPVSNRNPLLPEDEAAPLTPPVAPEPPAETAPATAPVEAEPSTVARVTTLAVAISKPKQHGKTTKKAKPVDRPEPEA